MWPPANTIARESAWGAEPTSGPAPSGSAVLLSVMATHWVASDLDASPRNSRPVKFCNDLDISLDGKKAAVVTYYGAFVFTRAKEESWADAFARKPKSLGPHGLPQAESIAFSKDGNSLLVVSEGKHSLIRSFSLKTDK